MFRASAELTQGWSAYLAGGAGLAVQLGHRRSVDLDWFTARTISPETLERGLEGLGYRLQVKENREGTFLGRLGAVHVSIFRYRYPLVSRPISYAGCRLASLTDIAAMKLSAIVGRATKRDYVDLHAIFNAGVSLSATVRSMSRKFPGVDVSLSLRALTHFADVERQAMPDMLRAITWDEIKRGLVRVQELGITRRGPTR